MRKRLGILFFSLLVVGAAVGVGAAQARVDPYFGQNGVVSVQPPLPAPWREQYIRHLAGAYDGDSYALFERQYCAGQAGCFSSNDVFRYLDNGTLDPAFGGPGGAYELPQEGEGIPAMAVDSQGRPLLAQTSPNRVVVRRLTSSGTPDPSFGEEGEAGFECDGCGYDQTQLFPGPGGTLTVAFPHSRFGMSGGGYGQTGTVLTLIRLRANGSRDSHFGSGGSVTLGLPGVGGFFTSVTARGGALYLVGGSCCGSKISSHVVRISARGRLDGRFTRAAQHSLRKLEKLNSIEQTVSTVLLRPGGKIDLLGSSGYEKGFLLRLRSNGQVSRKFGKAGLRVLPLPVASAALGSDGAIVATSDENLGGGARLMRILRGGRLDPAFGPDGVEIPGSAGDAGISVVHQTGRRALVLDLGFKECRGYCGATPKLVRFLERPASKRR